MQKFVNRKAELETLEKQYNGEASSLVIVYGRRRIGTAYIFLQRRNPKSKI